MTAKLSPAILQFSRETIARGSKSFAEASRLFDPATRTSAQLLYAWCRHCDDVIDGQTLGYNQTPLSQSEKHQALALLRTQTEAAINGDHVDDPAFAALAYVVKKHQIPLQYPLALLDGFAMDAEGRTFATLNDIMLYCYHVAGVVGIMMAYIMGVRDQPTLTRATDLGLAFQLTNIARDIVEDAGAGRLYIPLDWLRAGNLPTAPDELSQPQHRNALHAIAKRLIAEAEPYYQSATIGIRALPYRSAWAIAAAHAIYRDIGSAIVRQDSTAWGGRVSTSRRQKLQRVLQSSLAAINMKNPPPAPRGDLWSKAA